MLFSKQCAWCDGNRLTSAASSRLEESSMGNSAHWYVWPTVWVVPTGDPVTLREFTETLPVLYKGFEEQGVPAKSETRSLHQHFHCCSLYRTHSALNHRVTLSRVGFTWVNLTLKHCETPRINMESMKKMKTLKKIILYKN